MGAQWNAINENYKKLEGNFFCTFFSLDFKCKYVVVALCVVQK